MSRYRSTVLLILISRILTSGTTAAAEPSDDEPNWPFYRPRETRLPVTKQSEWIRNDIDVFVLNGLKDAGLKPAAAATKQQLIRRLYFDLIGLPPSPEEVARFLNDDSDKAYEQIVDRLLKDPRYGERWARFWLDLARYADTAGYEGDPDLPHAWRYRDYVIDAFNNDKPYDVFIKEQIAGDEFAEIMGAGDLPGTPPERTVAMTFLRLAPFTEPRGDESRHELLSEMTSTVCSVFLGLTVGCAKCHDHKYDEIPTEDFYRLKAFFSTVSMPRPEPGDGFQIGGPISAKFYRPGEADWAKKQKAAFEKEIIDSKRALAELKADLERRIGVSAGFGIQTLGGPLGNDYVFGNIKVNDGKPHLAVTSCDGKAWAFFTDGIEPATTGSLAGTNKGQWFGDIPGPKHVALGQYSEGTGTPKNAYHVGRFAEILIYDHALTELERKSLGKYFDARYSATNLPSNSPTPPEGGLAFWLDASDLDADPQTSNPSTGHSVSTWTDRIAGITIEQSDAELQPVLATLGPLKTPAVEFDRDFLVGACGDAAFLDNQRGTIAVAFSATHDHEGYGFEVGGDGMFLSTFINPQAATKSGLDDVIASVDTSVVSAEEKQRYRFLSTRERFLKQHIKRLSPVAMSVRHSYGPPYEPGVPVSRVMIRGQYDNPGDVVQAGFPRCVEGHAEPAAIRLDPFKRWPTRSRRMALAQWIGSPANPLTARVIVNRLWYRHFGRGIVPTPSDFGALSDGPSHPELLDWLALRLIQNKWSLKSIHKLIVMSTTWRQTSLRVDKQAEDRDPDNALLWRFRRRRLEAEAVRDNVLTVSGRLNPEQFGLPIFPPLPDDIEERVKYSDSKWATQYGPKGRKRSIYIYQQRTLTMPYMQAFDALVCDESRPQRRHSVTPLQALAMYNGRFVNEEAKYFAARVVKESGLQSSDQVDRAFEIALGRKPSEEEAKLLVPLIDESGPVAVCRVLLNSNEFVYVD